MSIVENGSAVLPYDRHVGRCSPALATRLIDQVGVRPGWRALDVGCGTGALTAALAQRLGAGRVAAVDSSPTAVEVCGERVPGADVRLAPAEQLPFGADRFDAVLSQLVIDKVDGPRAVAETRRVARSGAVIAAAVWDFEQGMTLLRAYWDAALVVDRPGATAVGGGEVPPNSRPAGLQRLWSDAGLEGVAVGELLVAADYDDLGDAWAPFLAGSGISGAYCRSLEPGAREELKREFARALGSPPGRSGSRLAPGTSWERRRRRPPYRPADAAARSRRRRAGGHRPTRGARRPPCDRRRVRRRTADDLRGDAGGVRVRVRP